MKTIIIIFTIFLFGCVSVAQSNRKSQIKECVKEFVNLDVPIKDATKSCMEIYENPYKDEE